jgi:primosomal protein N' (replication factor Y) (superfamily II helicase)
MFSSCHKLYSHLPPTRKTFQKRIEAPISGFMSQPLAIIADVLLPLGLNIAYSYRVSEGLAVEAGSYVLVPLGTKTRIGVVWAVSEKPDDNPKIRAILEVFDFPPLGATNRKFLDWLASYYLEPKGNVLRMALRCPGLFAPRKEQIAYLPSGTGPTKMTAQRQRVMDIASEGFALRAGELAEAAGVGTSVVKALVKDGALTAHALPPFKPFAAPILDNHQPILSPDQEAAARILRDAVTAQTHSVTLLDGVTGSGKTEVYFEAMAAALAQGKQVLLLLPEIALTTTFFARVEARFGAEPAHWHSEMKPRERERVWNLVATGQAKIVLGARSSLFLPWTSLRLIIVDEEHENAYKQEDGVNYHARDMAVLYGSIGKFPVILASATPSLETLVNADRNRYQTVRLMDRHGRAELPEISLIDMKQNQTQSGQWLSLPLQQAVHDSLAAGDQALLFLNRRGYAPLTLCRGCGHRLDCPNCAASLVEHRFRKQMQCHHCGYLEPTPTACPSCHVEGKLVPCGPGIERLTEEASLLFPEAKLAVLSSDMSRGVSLRDTLQEVARGEHNLIIGTQLVAKGHHFPHLTLVGVVDADLALETSDPRGGERTWALMAQVAGRAGRGEKPGRALIQTHLPNHPLMQALKRGLRDDYLNQEKIIRETAGLPPYGRLASIIVSGLDATETERFVREIARLKPFGEGMTILGPAPAPIHLVRGRHRWRFLIKATRDTNMQSLIQQWVGGIKVRGSLNLAIDIDPYSFL